MKIKSLTTRIAYAFVLLGLVVAGFFTVVSYFSVEVIESELIDTRLEKLADQVIGQFSRQQAPETPPDIAFYVDDTIPAELRNLSPGLHDAAQGDSELRVLVREEGGKRFMLSADVSDFEHTEFLAFSSLSIGFLASLLLAVLLGWATARRIVAPVTALAEAVARKDQATLPSLDAQDEIGVLARAFARRTDELQQFLMRERLFTGDVSHELRTPLTIMLGAAEVLQARLGDRPQELAAAERIRRVAAETAERVSALLMLSRSPETVDAPRIAFNAQVERELERCQFLLRGKPVQCHVDAPETVWVEARPELVDTVVGNLLRNACQHAGGTVIVRLRAGNLVIEDNGPGLPPKVQARLFERFVQGEDAAQSIGLGLSIVKRIVDHLGWQIRFETPEGGGSRFVIDFPPAGSPA